MRQMNHGHYCLADDYYPVDAIFKAMLSYTYFEPHLTSAAPLIYL